MVMAVMVVVAMVVMAMVMVAVVVMAVMAVAAVPVATMAAVATMTSTSEGSAIDRERGSAQSENCDRRHNEFLDGHNHLRSVQREYRLR